MEVLGVDIGGTNIKVGRVKEAVVLAQSHNDVDTKESAKATLNRLFKGIDEVITKETKAIGVGVPAVVDTASGVVYDVQNIPSWKEIGLADMLQQKYRLPIFINNDANCFAMGEKLFGKGGAYKNFVGLSIGTGLGMGIIINDELYNGVLSGAGEIGMLSYKETILEQYTSSFFFSDKYGLDAKTLHNMAQRKNERALEAFLEFGTHLGEALKNILYLFAPEAIVLGGSISKAFPLFKDSMYQKLNTFAYPRQLKDLKVMVSDLSDAPVLGAASLCFQNLKK
ncbi:ROK family protein [Spongiimicrobium sp. 3-5]|uniref:ROK family protein n=1 Tax=Spongiimicrobium sp. 3-5 TaxID=3332596 RepID=UPI0039803F81